MVRDLPPNRDSLPGRKDEAALKLEALWREIEALQGWVPPEKLEVLRLSLSDLLKADKGRGSSATTSPPQNESTLQPAVLDESQLQARNIAEAARRQAEDELRQQNEELLLARQMVDAERQRYRELFDFAPDGYLVTSSVGTILDANHAAAALLEARKEFLIGKPLIEFVAYQDRAVFSARLTDLQNGVFEKASDWEIELRTKDALPVPASLTVGGVLNSDGQLVGLRWSLHDIAERKRLEAERSRSEEQFRLVFEWGPVGMAIVELNGRYARVNQAFCNITGYPAFELLSRTYKDITHPDDLAANQMLDEKLLRGDIPDFQMEKRYLRKDGRVVNALLHATLIRDVRGRPIRYIAQVIDITERKQAEEALKESQRFIQRVAGTLPDILYVYDLVENRSVYANRQLVDVLGYMPDEVQALGAGFVPQLIHADDLKRVEEHLGQFSGMKDDEVTEIEYRMKAKDGRWRWLNSREMVFARAGNGNPTQVLGLAHDITERKRAEEMLQDAEARYRVLAESAQALITRSTPEGVYLYVSPACRTLLGFEPEEMVGHSGYEFLHPDDLPAIQASHKTLDQLPDTFTVTYRLRHQDGSYPWLLNTIRVVRDSQTNSVVELLAVSRNVAQD